MTRVFLSLGSNLGNRRFHIDSMLSQINRMLGPGVSRSRLWKPNPWVCRPSQQWFYNMVVSGPYRRTAHELLHECQAAEKNLGRTREKPMAERTADIDILLFGDDIISDARLTVPHPALQKRRFCIEGLFELAPDRILPGTGLTIAQIHGAMAAGIVNQKIKFLN